MNQKQIGAILLIIGILLAIAVTVLKVREDTNLHKIISSQNSCYLADGTCLHAEQESSLWYFIAGWIISGALIMLGIYLMVFDKTQQLLMKQHKEVSSALRSAKKQDKVKDEFKAFLSAFSEEEQKVLKAIKEQEGIQQATLRFRTGMSKASLSLMLKSLEEKGIITRKVAGKTNKVYLRKKF